MSRRRYLSTDASVDRRLNQLATCSDFAALVYVFMIPHADDQGMLHGDAEELMAVVMPMRRDKTVEDFTTALVEIHTAGLVVWDQCGERVIFPAEAFYRYQTYVKPENRRVSEPNAEERRGTPKPDSESNSEERRKTPQNAASFPVPVPPSSSVSSSAPPPVPARLRADDCRCDKRTGGTTVSCLISQWTNATGTTATAMLGDQIESAVEVLPPEWVCDAIRETGMANVKHWKYTQAILDRWKRDGRQDQNAPPQDAFESRKAAFLKPAFERQVFAK